MRKALWISRTVTLLLKPNHVAYMFHSYVANYLCNIASLMQTVGSSVETKILYFEHISVNDTEYFFIHLKCSKWETKLFSGSQNSVPQKDLRLRQTGGLRNSSSSGSSQDVRDATSSPRRPASYVHPSQLPQRWVMKTNTVNCVWCQP